MSVTLRSVPGRKGPITERWSRTIEKASRPSPAMKKIMARTALGKNCRVRVAT
jgi:hypothetical protein